MDPTRDLVTTTLHYWQELMSGLPIKCTVAGFTGLCHWLTVPQLEQAVVWLLISDWVTGLVRSYCRHEMDSDAGHRGAVKVLVSLAVLAVAMSIGVDGSLGKPLAYWLEMMVLLTEAISNLENLDAINRHYGIEMPIISTLIKIFRLKLSQTEDGMKGVLDESQTKTQPQPDARGNDQPQG